MRLSLSVRLSQLFSRATTAIYKKFGIVDDVYLNIIANRNEIKIFLFFTESYLKNCTHTHVDKRVQLDLNQYFIIFLVLFMSSLPLIKWG